MKVFLSAFRQLKVMKQILSAVFCALIILAFACGHPPPGRGAGEIESSSVPPEQNQDKTAGQGAVKFRVETVVSGLEVPWSIVWAPDGRMIFTERPGRVRVFQNGKLQQQPLFVVPDVEPSGESG
ncbi:MAG TPA: PQQ-dependent sugar dehydrogenase, partial [Pyrinomonadaceae bacterium]|nr:PQQ-dependent sugar dehydrogenase [Pyrinomonadaceae bacterium]